MDKDEIKARFQLLDERIPVLLKKYPVVSGVIIILPFVLGFIVGKLL